MADMLGGDDDSGGLASLTGDSGVEVAATDHPCYLGLGFMGYNCRA
jgi:hypothetical protein